MSAPQLSIVLPVYNEERVLGANLDQIRTYLETIEPDFELVCVDDGSSDRSAAILEEVAAKDPRVRIDRLPENRGKGAAVRKGMLAARGRRALFMDADLSTPLEEIPSLLGALDSGYDVVIGNRHAPGSKITRRQSLLREVLGKIFTTLTRLLLAPGVHDFTCGFKGFRQDAARSIFSRSLSNGWAFDAELVVIAQVQNCKLAQVPVAWRHEDGSKVRIASAVVRSLGELGVIAWNRLRGKYR